jgi:hypothetical protein
MIERMTPGRVTFSINGKRTSFEGEGFPHSPNGPYYLVYLNTIKTWADGTAITEQERDLVVDQFTKDASARGLNLQFE